MQHLGVQVVSNSIQAVRMVADEIVLVLFVVRLEALHHTLRGEVGMLTAAVIRQPTPPHVWSFERERDSEVERDCGQDEEHGAAVGRGGRERRGSERPERCRAEMNGAGNAGHGGPWMVIGVICYMYVLAVERVRLVDEEGDDERDEVHRHVERRHTHEL